MNKFNIFLMILILIFILVMQIMLIFTQQTITYSTSFDCKEIRDCILLEYSCYDTKIENKLFFFEWGFEREAWLSEQKQIYKEDCFNEFRQVNKRGNN